MINNKISLSIDVEDWYHTPLITGSPFSIFKNTDEFFKSWSGKYDHITAPMIRILEYLEKFQITATFFLPGEIVDRYPVIVDALKRSNHEIACHGYYHTIAIHTNTKEPLLSFDKWKGEVSMAKKLLEDTFGRRVIGYRAPGAYFANWMIDGLEELGFKYDSSVAHNSLYNKTNVKLKNIPPFPYYLNKSDLSNNNSNSGIMELPWSNLRALNFLLPVGGAFFFRLMGNEYFSYALKKNLKKGDTMFYFHPYDLAEEKPQLSNFRHRPFFWINQGKTTERRLVKLLKKFEGRFTSCEEVYLRNCAK